MGLRLKLPGFAQVSEVDIPLDVNFKPSQLLPCPHPLFDLAIRGIPDQPTGFNPKVGGVVSQSRPKLEARPGQLVCQKLLSNPVFFLSQWNGKRITGRDQVGFCLFFRITVKKVDFFPNFDENWSTLPGLVWKFGRKNCVTCLLI